MVRTQIRNRGIKDRRVLAAIAAVPREEFVSPEMWDRAYDDTPLPIGLGQTISQPYMVALMTLEAGVDRHSRVLEIGTGTGYQTAILAKLAQTVYTIERLPELTETAQRHLRSLGIENVVGLCRDGALGYPPAAPYDAIVTTAAAPVAPQPLVDQLADGGRLVIPVGDRYLQELMVIRRHGSEVTRARRGACRFVPLISPEAFDD